jgi:predicted SAM-dependent methyltransferase
MKRNQIALLKKIIRKSYKLVFRKSVYKINSFINKSGNRHECYNCGNTFNYLTKYHGGIKNIPEFRLKLNLVDSDRDNFGCPFCSTYDRERHLVMFFDKMNFWEQLPNFQILHFGPEKILSEKIGILNPIKYIRADFNPKQYDIKKIDATNIPYENNAFDLVICNHVLEHIPNYLTAISEIYRVLKPKGIAILQTPYSKVLSKNFEDKNINTDSLRNFFYGEKDHYRIFSEQHFLNDLRNAGFVLKIIQNREFFDDKTSLYYGVSNNEDLIQVIKNI